MIKQVEAGELKRIHVNVNSIRTNAKHGEDRQAYLPVCRVQVGDVAHYGDGVRIDGPSRMVYSPDKPLACGAKLWIETYALVIVDGYRPWSEACSREAL